jgi:hypothetical protein
VGSLLSWALSWLVVVIVGLAPMLVYWLARVIGQALRRKAAVHRRVTCQPSRRRWSDSSAKMNAARGKIRDGLHSRSERGDTGGLSTIQ